MKFANKLEALKWMCENPGRWINFTTNDHPECMISIDKYGYILGSVICWNELHAHNFRTTEKPEPEAKEMDWDRISYLVQAHPAMGANLDTRKAIYEGFLEYHRQLMKLLGRE